jgi:pilus assembly protein CpaC
MHNIRHPLVALLTATCLGTPGIAAAQAAAGSTGAPPPSAPVLRPCESVTVDPPTHLTLGKSRVIRLNFPAARLIVGGQSTSPAGRPLAAEAPQQGRAQAAPSARGDSDGVADTEITLLSPTELFFLGRRTGSMNVVLQSADGRCVVKDIVVTIDPETLQSKLGELMPEETGIRVRAADNAVVLTGSVSDVIKLDHVLSVAGAYGDGRKVVNLLRLSAPQQVMLEVKIAEVSKNLLDRFGLDFSRLVTSADGMTSSIISGIVGGGAATLGRFHPNFSGGAISGNAAVGTGVGSGAASASMSTAGRGASLLGIDAQKRDGIIRVLAEPNIMAISGQSASFLSGGKIFIPVAQDRSGGGSTITLEEKEFGVGLKFTPTVLDGGRINLKLVSEASELSQTGSPFTTVGGATAILPSMVTRRVDTTVQLGDGQSFVVAGLIKNNANEALNRFPGLGEVPVMGALFRSTEFQTDQTELMFVVTPRLIKPLNATAMLPTDNHIVPSRAEVILMGSGEGKPPLPARTAGAAPSGGTAASAPAPVVLPPLAAPAAVAPASPAPADVVLTSSGEPATATPVRTSAVDATPVAPVSAIPAFLPARATQP